MVIDFLIYFGQLLLLTLGAILVCGLAAWLAERLFLVLVGSGSSWVVYASSVIGTPIHELGHALMCLLFAHKITEVHLLLPPGHPSGTLGYVSHSYHPKNLWARLGNLFISIGPIFSGLGVMILMLFLCFPAQWNLYVTASSALSMGESSLGEVWNGVISLLLSMPSAFAQENWWLALIGIIVILSVSQHVTLSGADLKCALSGMPVYLILVLLFAGVTFAFGVRETILQGLWMGNLWILSLFSVAIAFSCIWIALGLLVFLVRLLSRRI